MAAPAAIGTKFVPATAVPEVVKISKIKGLIGTAVRLTLKVKGVKPLLPCNWVRLLIAGVGILPPFGAALPWGMMSAVPVASAADCASSALRQSRCG